MDSRAPPQGPGSHAPPPRQRFPAGRHRLPKAPPLADSSALHQSQWWIHGGLLDLVPSSAWSPAGAPPPRQDVDHLGPTGASRRGSPMLRGCGRYDAIWEIVTHLRLLPPQDPVCLPSSAFLCAQLCVLHRRLPLLLLGTVKFVHAFRDVP